MNTERDWREVEQDRNMKRTSFTNQPDLEDLDPQEIAAEDDPELVAIAAQLQETVSYAINPTFKEELRKELLQQFTGHRTIETKPTEDMDEILYSQLSMIIADIAKLPVEERIALLSDLANRLPMTEQCKSLEQALQKEGLQLNNSDPQSHENDSERKILLLQAYGHIIKLLKDSHG